MDSCRLFKWIVLEMNETKYKPMLDTHDQHLQVDAQVEIGLALESDKSSVTISHER